LNSKYKTCPSTPSKHRCVLCMHSALTRCCYVSLRTRQQVHESPMRDEIKHGTVVTAPKPSTPSHSVSSGETGSHSGGKKTSFRKS
jgi:hypothetical protein